MPSWRRVGVVGAARGAGGGVGDESGWAARREVDSVDITVEVGERVAACEGDAAAVWRPGDVEVGGVETGGEPGQSAA